MYIRTFCLHKIQFVFSKKTSKMKEIPYKNLPIDFDDVTGILNCPAVEACDADI